MSHGKNEHFILLYIYKRYVGYKIGYTQLIIFLNYHHLWNKFSKKICQLEKDIYNIYNEINDNENLCFGFIVFVCVAYYKILITIHKRKISISRLYIIILIQLTTIQVK